VRVIESAGGRALKIFIGAKRRMFITKSGVTLDKYGRYVAEYLSYVKLYGVELFGVFIGVICDEVKK
jgi:hypothetical protein